MFTPNNTCQLFVSSGKTDVYGQPLPEKTGVTEPCAIVRVTRTEEKTSVRADSSGSRGNAREIIAEAQVLLLPSTVINIDDIVMIGVDQYRVMMKHPQYNIVGVLDHYKIIAAMWR
jgi:hypothetical protein